MIEADREIVSAYSDACAERRFWEIDGFARVPCGGTHLRRTGEIGALTLDAGAFPPRIVVYDPTGYPLAQSTEGKALALEARLRGRHTIVVWDTVDEFDLSLRPLESAR